ncbi:hypothetical protein IOD16_13295 [Saccharothrix sp. 6-C]|uniref:hypothetical protein n=1 Tax=Saccharothrix sp. 6-C TaxID=2781735 RepID=UPI0019172DC7|nr:hypothetical protein [Saccharothrix sp. 6-C]QQQ79307.1 hypothetical protein IOD16_13295 [Saccharothrix sp. 6-C]
MPRRFASFLASVLLAAAGVVATTGAAGAVTVEQVCVGTWAVTYDPPITNTPRVVEGHLTGYFPTCTNLAAPSGSYDQVFTDTVSCATLLSAGAAARTYTWSNPLAAPTTFAYNWTVSDVAGQAVITNTGLITGGTFAGASAEQVAVLVTPDVLGCGGAGISSLTGPTTLTVFRP